MITQLTILLLLTSVSTGVFAESFDIEGKGVTIPPPDGYVRVTTDMDAVHRLSMQMHDPMNDLLAYYISESDVPAAMDGYIPPLEKTFALIRGSNLRLTYLAYEDKSTDVLTLVLVLGQGRLAEPYHAHDAYKIAPVIITLSV